MAESGIERIYRTVLEAYGNGEPSASSPKPWATGRGYVPPMEPIPKDSFVGELLKGPEDPNRDLRGGSFGAKIGRLAKLYAMDYPYELAKDIDRVVDDPGSASLTDVTALTFEAMLSMVPGGGTGVANMIKHSSRGVREGARALVRVEKRARFDDLGGELKSPLASDRILDEGTFFRGQGTNVEVRMGTKTAKKLGDQMDILTREYDRVNAAGSGNRLVDYDTGIPVMESRQYGEWTARRPDYRDSNPDAPHWGEPVGVSLSSSPTVASNFAKKSLNEDLMKLSDDELKDAYKKSQDLEGLSFQEKSYKKDIAQVYKRRFEEMTITRVLPLFGGVPQKNVVKAWTPEGQVVLKEAYEKAMREMVGELHGMDPRLKVKSQKKMEELHLHTKQDEVAGIAYHHMRDMIEKAYPWGQGKERFNFKLTGNLQEKGFKGIMYSPNRYSEYELKMFDPRDVLALDQRKWAGSGFDETLVPKNDPAIQRTIFPRTKGTEAFPRGIAYDGRKTKAMDAWKAEAEANDAPPNLRAIYKTLELQEMLEQVSEYKPGMTWDEPSAKGLRGFEF